MDIVEDVRNKLEDYGITIFSDYPLNESEHLFMADNVILFVHTERTEIGVSFQAETRPKTVGDTLLIIMELFDRENIDIMESFVVDENKKFISGEKAFELISKKNQYEAMNEIFKDQTYTEMLLNGTSGEC